VTTWLVNGQRHGMVTPEDRGLAYGDGLFETIALRAGDFRFLDYHFERLALGCRRLGLPSPDGQLLREELHTAAAGAVHGTAKVVITRGSGPRGYAPPPAPVPTRIVGVTPASAGPPGGAWHRGIRVRFCATVLGENPALAGLKTLNRLEQVLARAEWDLPAVAEGLMMTAGGEVICGTSSNLFLVSGGNLLTPVLDRSGVSGVMRRVVMEAADEAGLAVREARLGRVDVDAAEELFMTNSLRGIAPVIALEQRQLRIGATTRKLMLALAARGVSECAGA
jgi:4-amino-4-deoxychorismate lyase